MPWLKAVCMQLFNNFHLHLIMCLLTSNALCFSQSSILHHYVMLPYGDDQMQELLVVFLQYFLHEPTNMYPVLPCDSAFLYSCVH